MEPQHLSDEHAETDVDAGNEAQEASQVLGGDLTEVHRHHTERDSCWKKCDYTHAHAVISSLSDYDTF